MADVRNTVNTAINMSKPSNERDMVNQSTSLTDTAESDGNWCDKSVETNLTLGTSSTCVMTELTKRYQPWSRSYEGLCA